MDDPELPEERVTHLSDRDRDIFLAALADTEKRNAALIAAAECYKAYLAAGPISDGDEAGHE